MIYRGCCAVLAGVIWTVATEAAAPAGTTPGSQAATYTVADFEQVRKFDLARAAANTDDRHFLDIAHQDGFDLLSINVDYPDFPKLEEQARVAHKLQAEDPRHFHFLTTFSMKGFGSAILDGRHRPTH